MPLQHLLLTFSNMINTSIQIGDIVYYNQNITQSGSFDIGGLNDVIQLGVVIEITSNTIKVEYNDSIVSAPEEVDFIMFAKDKTINTSSLIGYYADVKFANDSNYKIELFSVGSDIFESSK